EHIAVEPVAYDSTVAAPENGIVVQSIYTSYDPYMRGRMRPAEVKSYAPAFLLNEPIQSASIARVIRSNRADYKEGDLVLGGLPIQEYIALNADEMAKIRHLSNPL